MTVRRPAIRPTRNAGDVEDILVVAHGSPDAAAVEEIRACVELVQGQVEGRVRLAFLEFNQPSLSEVVDELIREGAGRLAVVPLMLAPGRHWYEDIPGEIHRLAQEVPQLQCTYAAPLVEQPAILELAAQRVREASDDGTLLLVVARGSRRPEVQGQLERFVQTLAELLGFRHGRLAYASIGRPTVEEVLPRVAEPTVLLPFFLFTGVLVKRIRDFAHTYSHVRLAPHLGPHPLLAEAILAAAQSATPLSRSNF